MLRQRTHERRPEQPELGLEELRREGVLDELTVQPRFGRERQLCKSEAVAKAKPVPRPMDGAKVAIDDVRLVDERVLVIESEELLADGYRRVG